MNTYNLQEEIESKTSDETSELKNSEETEETSESDISEEFFTSDDEDDDEEGVDIETAEKQTIDFMFNCFKIFSISMFTFIVLIKLNESSQNK